MSVQQDEDSLINSDKDAGANRALLTGLERLSAGMDRALAQHVGVIGGVHPAQKLSISNLIEYLSLRCEDIRPLQDRLHTLGLSSLNSSESHIHSQLQAVQQLLGKKTDNSELPEANFHTAKNLILRRSIQLFGRKAEASVPYLMVTIAADVARHPRLAEKLLKKGMNVARINCGHDNEEVWAQMIRNIRGASKKTGISCKIYMDLAGPKMRTIIRATGKPKKRNKDRIRLREGKKILFAEKNAVWDPSAAVIGCRQPGIAGQLRPGDRVLFDDGLVEMRVAEAPGDLVPATLEVVRISSQKPRLKADKSINLPDTVVELPALTDYDHSVLPFICRHADLVGYSFVRRPADVKELQQAMGGEDHQPHIILKIETSEAVNSFPAILIQAMRDEVFGVMVARGDLAVEIGFERLSEIQEELVWISEAAHAPVIWGTQILDSLGKWGLATRAEVTDAAYAAIAECVMINKGKHIFKVIRTLRDILKRSGTHHVKKRYTCRAMTIAQKFFGK
jgi:pyruvate kinase